MKDSTKTLRTMQSAKEKAKKIGYACGAAALTASAYMPFAAAAPSGGSDAKGIVATFLAYILDMFICVGAMLGVWAIAQLALAFKNEDADSKSKAMMMLMTAVILIGIGPLASNIIPSGLSIGTGFLGIQY